VTQQTLGSYVQAAATSKLYEEFPNMLYVHTGMGEKCPISLENFNALAAKLRKQCCRM
jgi:hypothetical protein